MDSRDLIRLELMLKRDAEPLCGFVREADDQEWRAFSGWLALARELEQASEGDEAERGS
ncbi:MAG: hypothetical protein QOI31_1283 [Solirubrobacterales bacterium]|jgi:hypothetical protein|nr:hypothetical protein [Solirubrobacterales bacterium]